MKRRIKTVVAVTTLALTASASISAEACDRGGRRISLSRGPIGVSYSSFNRYSKPAYAPPVYSQPAYSQPVYSQPQVVYQQPVQAPTSPQVSTFPPQNAAPPQQPASPAMMSGQPVNGQPVNGQPINNRAPASMPRASAPPQQAPAASPRTVTNNRGPATTAAPTATTAPQKSSSQMSAEASALQLLASMMTTDEGGNANSTATATTAQIPEFVPADSDASSSAAGLAHVGTWNVNLPGNQSVQLALNADGSFTWTATKNGNSSNFQGQYRLDNDRLTLVRSNDLNQMAGSWTINGEGFTFKLDGATTGGLTFSRS